MTTTAEWEAKLGLLDIPTTVVEEPTKEVGMSLDQVQEAARNSLDFLAALAMPTIFKYFFPATYLEIWKFLLTYVHKERDFSQIVLGLPRGFAKTTLIKLGVLYFILFTKKKFILVCCENQSKGNNIISDVIDMLNESNIRKVFGNWDLGAEVDRLDLKKFGFRGRDIILMAATVATVRGINLKNSRPDVMIFDDIQSRADAESETISKQIETDMVGTAMKAKSPEGCLFVFIGNMYPTKWSILRKLKTNPNWIKFIAGGILSDGTSLWEELQPIEQLKREYLNDLAAGRPEIFFAEVLNDENATVNHLIDLSKIPTYAYQSDEYHSGNFIVIDPSNDKANSDAVSIMYFEVHDAKPVCKLIKEGRLSPGETIREALTIALSKGCHVIGVESVAYQYSLLYWFGFITQQMGIVGVDAVELYSGSASKNSRIVSMFKSLIAGEIVIHPDCRPQCDSQIISFNPLKTNNTDGLLDCLTYAPKMIELYGHLILSHSIIEAQSHGKLRVHSELETSCF